jgi:hypothetical protein
MTHYQDRQRKLARSAVLTEFEVMTIKKRLGHFAEIPGTGKREWPRDLAKEYGVSTETIRRIDRGDTWGWLIPESPEIVARKQLSDEEMKRLADESLARLEGLLTEKKP